MTGVANSGLARRFVSQRLGTSPSALQDTFRIGRPESGSKTMEAASRPAFEPLADLPVEEPFGLNGSASQVGGARPSSTASPASPPPASPPTAPMESDEDLLAHGVLLDMSPAPSTASSSSTTSAGVSTSSVTEAPYDSGLIPTLLLSAAELLDPEVLLGPSEPPVRRTESAGGADAGRGPAASPSGLRDIGATSASAVDITKSSGSRVAGRAPAGAPSVGGSAAAGTGAAVKGNSPLGAHKPGNTLATTPTGASRPVGISTGARQPGAPQPGAPQPGPRRRGRPSPGRPKRDSPRRICFKPAHPNTPCRNQRCGSARSRNIHNCTP